MNSLTNGFSDVNETFPKVGSVGMIMGQFAGASDGFTNKPSASLDNINSHDM